MLPGKILAIVPQSKEVLGPVEVRHCQIGRKAMLGVDQDVGCLQGGPGECKHVTDRNAVPRVVQLCPTRHAMYVVRPCSTRQAKKFLPGKPHRMLDKPGYLEGPG